MKKKKRKSKIVREDTVHAYRVRETASAALRRGNVISAAEFKANCLSLMDDVHDRGIELLITKHNTPVARLVPVVDEAGTKFIGRGAGIVAVRGGIVSPTAPDWEEGADL